MEVLAGVIYQNYDKTDKTAVAAGGDQTRGKPARAAENAEHQRRLRESAGPHPHSALREETEQGNLKEF